MHDALHELVDANASGRLGGKLTVNAALKRYTWFRTGGPADALYEPADQSDLQKLLHIAPADLPITIIGGGSNLLVRDGGVRGLVIRLGHGFAAISVRDADVIAGAGAMDAHVAKKAAEAGVEGLEYLVGVPGTIGGALAMNAGAYGGELAANFVSATAVDRAGNLRVLEVDDFDFDYRRSGLPDGLIVTEVRLRGKPGAADKARERMSKIMSDRSDSQPIGTRTGGSTFKNPSGHKAWQLVDQAGGRGLSVGGAQMSEKHCNFMINTGTATAADLEQLGDDIRARVAATSGVQLEWEIRRIGDALAEGTA